MKFLCRYFSGENKREMIVRREMIFFAPEPDELTLTAAIPSYKNYFRNLQSSQSTAR